MTSASSAIPARLVRDPSRRLGGASSLLLGNRPPARLQCKVADTKLPLPPAPFASMLLF
jgi:hypothetical protein